MKLSQVQEKALAEMKLGQWYYAYDLQCGMRTLYALKKKGYVDIRGYDAPGAFSIEQNVIKFSKIK